MNCKPGDMAVIVRGNLPSYIGMIITVRTTYTHRGSVYWTVEPPLPPHPTRGPVIGVQDACLQPIRGTPPTIDTRVTMRDTLIA